MNWAWNYLTNTWTISLNKEKEKMTKVYTILKRARNLIADKGWAQCTSVKHDKHNKIIGYCLTGAIDKVRGTEASDFTPRVIWECMGFYTSWDAVNYNDNPNRRKNHVIRKLERGMKVADEYGFEV